MVNKQEMMEKSNLKTRSSQVMELKQLIAGPLIATIDADSLSARRYLDYLFEIAFESYDRKTGKTGKLRMLTFSYNNSDAGGERRQQVSIPMLTLVPLPLLQVKEAEFDFDIKILDTVTEKREETFSLEEGKAVGPEEGDGDGGFTMRASLAPKQGEGSSSGSAQQGLSANMKVHVKMQQADMPGGLANLLHLTANNVQMEESEPNGNENESGATH